MTPSSSAPLRSCRKGKAPREPQGHRKGKGPGPNGPGPLFKYFLFLCLPCSSSLLDGLGAGGRLRGGYGFLTA
jgi:hypothetical protein